MATGKGSHEVRAATGKGSHEVRAATGKGSHGHIGMATTPTILSAA